MLGRNFFFAAVTVFGLSGFSSAEAGDRVHASKPSAAPSQPAAAPIVTRSVSSITVVVVPVPTAPATEPLVVGIRGPNGEVRRFPVEGGSSAIQSGQIVLRPGQSITVQWTAAK
jgi:hypothetical protein